MKRIGEILIENGTLTQAQLDKALEDQEKAPGKLLGKILIDLGFVTEEDIVVALATQFNVPYLPLGNFTFNETLADLFPKELIQKYLCVPLERIGNLLTVVMADPTNEDAIREIEAATNYKVQAFVATATEITTAIQQQFHLSVSSIPEIGEAISRPSLQSAAKRKAEDKSPPKS